MQIGSNASCSTSCSSCGKNAMRRQSRAAPPNIAADAELSERVVTGSEGPRTTTRKAEIAEDSLVELCKKEYSSEHLLSCEGCTTSNCEEWNTCGKAIPPVSKENLVAHSHSPIQSSYVIKEKLGHGTWGSVHLAIERSSGIARAVKKISKRAASELPRFRSEIHFLKGLDHPGVVRLHETYEDFANIYMVMEYCSGGELFDKLCKSTCFSESYAAKVMLQILAVVCYLHRKQICHRDLKPENFLFVTGHEDSPLKLIDFGLGKRFSSRRKMRTKVGTLYYVAPELLGGKYDEKCDLWSAGVVMYILLSGTPPFCSDNDMNTIAKIQDAQVTFREPAWLNCSPAAMDLVRRLMSANPERRLSAEAALQHPWFKQFGHPLLLLRQVISAPGALKTLRTATPTRRTPMRTQNSQSFDSAELTEKGEGDDLYGLAVCPGKLQSLARVLMGRWVSFAKSDQLQRTAMRLMVQQVSETELPRFRLLREFFVFADTQYEGYLTAGRLLHAYVQLNNIGTEISDVAAASAAAAAELGAPSVVALSELLACLSLDGSPSIEYSDFLAASCDWQTLVADEKHLKCAFRVFDKGGDGQVARGQLRGVLGWAEPFAFPGDWGLCQQTIEEELSRIFQTFDPAGSGSITYDSFKRVMAGRNMEIFDTVN